ncbi:efflux RND transporter permease subunit [Rhodoflexus sp.]
MWEKVADIVLKYRFVFIALLLSITAFMGYQARKVEMSYDFVKVVPQDDPEMLFFKDFLQTFGEDGNLFVIGLKDSALYRYDNFRRFQELATKIQGLKGINQVLSLPTLQDIRKNEVEKRFEVQPVFSPLPRNQQELDSMLKQAKMIKFYEGQIWNYNNGATMIVAALKREILGTSEREQLVFEMIRLADEFSAKTGIQMHYSGIPYIRTVVAKSVKHELNIFLLLSLVVTVVVMYLFFRSVAPVLFSVILIGIVVVWTMGTLGMLGYKITMLTGLLPPILVVIGIPNCVYLLTKYHQEYIHSHNQQLALKNVVKKIGVVALITNTTTAIGFLVLLTVDISILREFGTVAAINIANTFCISLIFIPAVFSYLPPPSLRNTRHLERRNMQRILNLFVHITDHHRTKVYVVCLVLVVVSIIGVLRIRAVSYMVDDLPEESVVVRDLAFFEENFIGIMPLEIIVDTGKPKATRDLKRLRKIRLLEDSLRSLPYVSPPLSVVTFVKAANQALGTVKIEETYALPTQSGELLTIERYTRGQKGQAAELANSFTDSSGQRLRISLKVADIGSLRTDSLMKAAILPQIDSALAGTDMTAHVTGTTLLFLKGNDYLIANMRQSLFIAIGLIGAIIGLLFKNARIMALTIASNLLPILMTAGMMGFLGIPLKPSTALIFSIAFGIAVDDAVHYLARYRQALKLTGFNVAESVRIAIHETGISMMYTSIVLFGGFIIFTWSDFGATQALGALTSSTLIVAMITNLVLLPCLLNTFSKGKEDQAEPNEIAEEIGSYIDDKG